MKATGESCGCGSGKKSDECCEKCWSDCLGWAYKANLVLLGLVMLVPGLSKLFLMGPANVAGFLAGLGIPAAGVLVWVLIVSEIVSGAAILASPLIRGIPLKYIAWLPVVVLVVAAATTLKPYGANMPSVLLHLIAASNFAIIALGDCSGWGVYCSPEKSEGDLPAQK